VRALVKTFLTGAEKGQQALQARSTEAENALSKDSAEETDEAAEC